jgi:hypothetical protein
VPTETFDLDELDRDLEQRHRDVMLELVLAWGTLDGALGMLISGIRGLPFHEGAEQIGAMPASAEFAEFSKAMRWAGFPETASTIKRYKKVYEAFSVIRNRIAHSHCLGIWTVDRDFIVFALFQKIGNNQLAIQSIPIQNMQKAIAFGTDMNAKVMEVVKVICPEMA